MLAGRRERRRSSNHRVTSRWNRAAATRSSTSQRRNVWRTRNTNDLRSRRGAATSKRRCGGGAARRRIAPLVAKGAAHELERALDHNEGDRRLDGSDLIETPSRALTTSRASWGSGTARCDGSARPSWTCACRRPTRCSGAGRAPASRGLAPTRLYGLPGRRATSMRHWVRGVLGP